MTQQTKLQQLLAQAREAAELASIDMSQTSTGGQKRLLPEGYSLARLVEYIELGKHAGEYNGKPKPPALMFRLGFALYTPGYCNEDGTPYVIRTFDLSLGNNEKAKAKIAFDRMNYRQQAKHFAEFLGEAFLLKIIIKKSKTAPFNERNEISFAEIAPPIEALSKQPYVVPEAAEDLYKLFLWDVPTKEGWDSIFIEGVNDQGKSKNYLQGLCLEATNFEGSPLQQMLQGPLPNITVPTTLGPQVEATQPTVAANAAEPPFEPPYTQVPTLGPTVAQSVAQATPAAATAIPSVSIPQLGPLPTIPKV